MTASEKTKRKRYPPGNVSLDYFTDPVYSSDGFYGFEGDYGDTIDEGIQEEIDLQNREAPDEPVESWGWINNVDNKQF